MNPQIPFYISLLFLVAICFPIYMIANLASRFVDLGRSKVIFFGIIVFYTLYLSGVAIATFNGAFLAVSLPPKIIQFTTFPLLLFLLGFVFNTRFYKGLLKSVPVDELILLHRFRLIGSFFIVLMLLQLLPRPFALIAGLGDVITALSSIWIAKRIREGRRDARQFALAWNTFGFLDILITSATAILLTKWSIETGSLGVDVLATFPFCFIPAFAPATIIFLHMSIYRKLMTKKFQ
ncbi:MAG: hypothetical protein AAGA85_03870 [Bacteroidota bacterium]